VKNHPATRNFVPDFSRKCSDADALLFQPHIAVKLGKAAMPSHHDAFKMITTKIKNSSLYTKSEREAAGRIWAEFMLPWFDLPIHWVLDEIRDSFRGKISSNVVKCKFCCPALSTLSELQHLMFCFCLFISPQTRRGKLSEQRSEKAPFYPTWKGIRQWDAATA
jgi:hypothetical protein